MNDQEYTREDSHSIISTSSGPITLTPALHMVPQSFHWEAPGPGIYEVSLRTKKDGAIYSVEVGEGESVDLSWKRIDDPC